MKNKPSLFKLLTFSVFFCMILGSCTLDLPITQSTQETPLSDPLPINETMAENPTQENDSQLYQQPTETGSNPVQPTKQGVIIHDEDPIQFSFPTPAPAPISSWRPPLYETPWSLSPYDHFYFSRPIAANEINWPLANYRYGGIFFGPDIVHTGIDIPAPRGTPVIAAEDGEVIWAGYGLYLGTDMPNDPYGLAVEIKHDFGYEDRRLFSVYAHLDRVDVNPGEFVTKGTQLGIVGLTGKTTGPHLHFETRIEEDSFYATRNPELWLAPPQGWGVLVGQLRNTNGSFLTEQLVRVTLMSTNQTWEVISYGSHTVNMDEYYQENLVLSDLPAGDYKIRINYLGEIYTYFLQINPGAVTYFKFRGEKGYSNDLPKPPQDENIIN